jgi:uncharacterized protein
MAPVAPSRRIEAIDILRGIAILGIFLVNMGSYAGFRQSYEQMATVDQAATVLVRFTAQAKFYPLFSLLFGWGLIIQMERAERRGAAFVPLYLRRMLALLLIGLVHAILIWHGDILVTYALLGFPLLLFRKASDRVLIVAIILCFLVPIAISTPGPGADFREAYNNATTELREDMIAGKQQNVFVAGTYGESVVQRWHQLRFNYALSLYWITHVFGMMLLGILIGRHHVFLEFERYEPRWRRIFWWSLALGIVLNAVWVFASVKPDAVPAGWYDMATRGVRTIAGPMLTMAYLSGVLLLARRAAWRGQLTGLAAVGRMSLTNYLAQSVVFTLFFYGYGLGVYGEMGPLLTLLLCLAFFRLQIWFSQWWLARYRFGPVEWLWRSMTYGKLQPMRTRRVTA